MGYYKNLRCAASFTFVISCWHFVYREFRKLKLIMVHFQAHLRCSIQFSVTVLYSNTFPEISTVPNRLKGPCLEKKNGSNFHPRFVKCKPTEELIILNALDSMHAIFAIVITQTVAMRAFEAICYPI